MEFCARHSMYNGVLEFNLRGSLTSFGAGVIHVRR